MVKTNKKSLIAMIAMVVLLIASIAMGITGAWFTDVKNGSTENLTFGTVKLGDIDASSIVASNLIETTNTNLMPGSTISGIVTVENTGNSAAWLRYKVEIDQTSTGKDYVTLEDAGVYQYVDAAVSGGAIAEITINASVAKTVANAAQGKSVKLKITVEALQQANTEATNSATIWADVTVVEAE